MRCAALNTGPDFHLLDHIAPLSHLIQMPLFLTDEKNYELTLRYYPKIEAHYMPDLEHNLAQFAERFDVLFECKYWAPYLKRLFRDLYRKNMVLVFCPHGQSDKGYSTPLLAPYAEQDIVLRYGELMKEMLSDLNVKSNSVRIGNYRLHFYLQNKMFFDAIAEKEIFSQLSPQKKTLLYAPTWRDADQATSFFRWAPSLLSELPDDWNLILKIHPLLEQRDPANYYKIAALADRSNTLLVSEFPLVYPLLARSDAYLGDYSSVGYDFLTFRRPMFFFLNPSLPRGKLHSCGIILDSPKNLFRNMDPYLVKDQIALEHHAFGDAMSEKEIRREILKKCLEIQEKDTA